jgi:hypothetical protein
VATLYDGGEWTGVDSSDDAAVEHVDEVGTAEQEKMFMPLATAA